MLVLIGYVVPGTVHLLYSKICIYCNKEFIAKRKDKIFCSRLCKTYNYQKNNRDKINLSIRKRYQKDKTKFQKRSRKWKNENPEKLRIKDHKRRTIKKNAAGFFTEQDIQLMYHDQFESCIGCNRKFSGQLKYTIDHIIPLSKGGSNWPENIQLLCGSCNYSKGIKDMDTWLSYRKENK